jgi:hypothetical protein
VYRLKESWYNREEVPMIAGNIQGYTGLLPGVRRIQLTVGFMWQRERHNSRVAYIPKPLIIPGNATAEDIVAMLEAWSNDDAGDEEDNWQALKTELNTTRARLGMRTLFDDETDCP